MNQHEFLQMYIDLIPPEFVEKYDLYTKVLNGYIYVRIIQCMYGLPQAGMLANNLLKEWLGNHGCFEVPHTPGLFAHKTHITKLFPGTKYDNLVTENPVCLPATKSAPFLLPVTKIKKKCLSRHHNQKCKLPIANNHLLLH